MRILHSSTTLLAVLACLALGGCGSDPQNTSPGPAAAPQAKPSATTTPPMPESKPVATAATPSSGNGKSVYEAYCTACHQADGKGLPGAFPPLANADYFLADTRRAIAIVLAGKSGPITVNGVGYDALMPPFDYLSDEDIAAALTYALNAWGNAGGTVTAAQVAAVRNAD